MSEVWWVRHGPTHAKSMVGWRDLPADLSDKAALARLSALLPDRAALVASDLSRARTTADALAAPGRARLPDTPALREFDFGAWDGLGFAEIARRDPELSRVFWEAPGDVAPPGGESWNAVAARVSAFVDAQALPLIAVAHLGVIMTQIGRALGAQAALAEPIDTLSVTRLRRTPDGWHAVEINRVP